MNKCPNTFPRKAKGLSTSEVGERTAERAHGKIASIFGSFPISNNWYCENTSAVVAILTVKYLSSSVPYKVQSLLFGFKSFCRAHDF